MEKAALFLRKETDMVPKEYLRFELRVRRTERSAYLMLGKLQNHNKNRIFKAVLEALMKIPFEDVKRLANGARCEIRVN